MRKLSIAILVALLSVSPLYAANTNFGGVQIDSNSDGATTSSTKVFKINNTSGTEVYSVTAGGVVATTGAQTITGDVIVAGTTPSVTVGDAGEEDAQVNFDGNAQDFHIGLDDSADDLIIGLGTALGTTPIISMTDTGVTTVTGSTDGDLTIYGAGTSASDAYLRLVGDAQADASDSWQLFNDSSAASLLIGNDSTTPGTYVTKLTLASTGVLTSALGTVHTSEATSALTPGATPTLTVSAGRQIFTYQPADNTDATFNASGAGSAGDEMIFIFTTDAAGSGDEVMTFGTNMISTGTLTMANLASDVYVVSFISNGTTWYEKSRTAVQTT